MALVRSLTIMAVLFAATPSLAQTMAVIEELERLQAEGTNLAQMHRVATQDKIDRATRALRDHDYKAAHKFAAAVTQADPNRVEAWLLLGASQMGLQDWKRARASYLRALRIWPAHPQAHAGLGVAMARSKDPRAAVQLAWFDDQLRACGGCYRAAELTKFKGEVQAAITASERGP